MTCEPKNLQRARIEHEASAQALLNELHALLNVYRARMLATQGGKLDMAQRTLTSLHGKKLVVENRLNDVIAANDERWEELKDQFQTAADDLDSEIKRAIKGLYPR